MFERKKAETKQYHDVFKNNKNSVCNFEKLLTQLSIPEKDQNRS